MDPQIEGGRGEVTLPGHAPDFSAADSPDEAVTGSHSGDINQVSVELPPPTTTDPPTLTDELRDKIIKQVEYYFSDENLRNDKFLLKYLTKDEEGYVPVAVIASFRKMKKLTHHKSLVVAALRESSFLILSSDEKKVKRSHPFPLTAFLDPELCTVLVENLPENHTVENMKKIFGDAGSIKKITIHEEHDTGEPKKRSIDEKLLIGKLHAVVEYETIEAAENAVATLNNEHDWRHGMRVKLLKRRGKNAHRKNVYDSEKKNIVQVTDSAGDKENHQTSEHHGDAPHELQNEEHPSKEKNENRGQNRRQFRRHKYHGPNGLGHGTVLPHNHGGETMKPPPGPKMPDGTRGFTMGRGRPPIVNQN